MTHVKNADSFARIVDVCTGYGGSYNPGKKSLRIEDLNTQKQEVQQALTAVITARALYDNEINQRKQVFDQLSRLASSIMRTLEASDASAEKLEDARTFARQLVGSVTHLRPPVPSPESKSTQVAAPAGQTSKSHRSTLQLAYASRADWFTKLVNAVATEPLYQTNEPHLSVAGLTDKVNQLNTLNQRVSTARVAWSNSLIDRNEALYGESKSVYKTARAVKKYVRALYGHDSEQYAQVSSISFTKPGKS